MRVAVDRRTRAPISAHCCATRSTWGSTSIGGCPHLETDPAAANDSFLTIAAEAGLPVDLHTDETLEPGDAGLGGPRRAGGRDRVPAQRHGQPLRQPGLQSEHRQREVAEKVAAAGISVIALPHTNLFLQGRDSPVAMPRALTAVKALRAAGVNVAAGADNLQDPFNPVGRGDPLETAGLMIMAAHLLPDDALRHGQRRRARRRWGSRPSDGSRRGRERASSARRSRSARPIGSWSCARRLASSGNRAFTRSRLSRSGRALHRPMTASDAMGTSHGRLAGRRALITGRGPWDRCRDRRRRSGAKAPSWPWSTSTSSGCTTTAEALGGEASTASICADAEATVGGGRPERSTSSAASTSSSTTPAS